MCTGFDPAKVVELKPTASDVDSSSPFFTLIPFLTDINVNMQLMRLQHLKLTKLDGGGGIRITYVTGQKHANSLSHHQQLQNVLFQLFLTLS